MVFPAGIYLLKVNDRDTKTKCEICSKLTITGSILVRNWITNHLPGF